MQTILRGHEEMNQDCVDNQEFMQCDGEESKRKREKLARKQDLWKWANSRIDEK